MEIRLSKSYKWEIEEYEKKERKKEENNTEKERTKRT